MTAPVPEMRRAMIAYATDAGGHVPVRAGDLAAVLDAAEAIADAGQRILEAAEARHVSVGDYERAWSNFRAALAHWRALTDEVEP